MNYSRLTLVLTESEMMALREVARQSVRRPRDQARYMLLSGLGMSNERVTSTQQPNGAPLEDSANTLSAS